MSNETADPAPSTKTTAILQARCDSLMNSLSETKSLELSTLPIGIQKELLFSFLSESDKDALSEASGHFNGLMAECFGRLGALPVGIQKTIVSFLEVNDQRAFGSACKRCSRILDEDVETTIEKDGVALLKEARHPTENIHPRGLGLLNSSNRKQTSRFLFKTREVDSCRMYYLRVDKFLPGPGAAGLQILHVNIGRKNDSTGASEDVSRDTNLQKVVPKLLLRVGGYAQFDIISFDGGVCISLLTDE